MSDKQVEAERKRGDYFRDALVEMYGCPPPSVQVMCEHGSCPFMNDDWGSDAAECWDDVAARAVGGHDEQID